MQADPSFRRLAPVVRLRDQGAQGAAVPDAAVVVIQHLLEGCETAVMHVGPGEGDVSQRRYFEQPAMRRVAGDRREAGLQVFLVIEAVVGEPVVARTEAAGQELAVTVDAVGTAPTPLHVRGG